jgi:hypothetical protein
LSYQANIDSGVRFLKGLMSHVEGWYWEVADKNHVEHKIYPQSQYLFYITSKRLKFEELAHQIQAANSFDVCAVDREIYANARFCVLDDETPPFYLANRRLADLSNYDEIALLGHYRALRSDMTGARECSSFLKRHWNPTHEVLEMDGGDKAAKNGAGLFRIYKTALAGTLFARVGESTTPNCASIARKLQQLQDLQNTGGWITDRTANWEPDGVPNIETTCLALLCLDCAQNHNSGMEY